MLNRSIFLGAVIASLALAPSARAQGEPANPEAAATLFGEAKKLVEQGKYAEGCAKFEASFALMKSTGALLNLAQCREKNGQLATAYGKFREVQVLARANNETDRLRDATQLADALEPRLSKLLLDVAAGNRGAGVTIKEDGREIPEAAWGSALPVDSGEHTIEASAQGKQTWKATVRIEAVSGTTTAAVPVLEVAATPEAPVVAPFWTSQRTAGLSVGAVGAGVTLIGAILGGVTVAKVSSLKSSGDCNAGLTSCDANGLTLRQDAKTMANAATGMLIGGGVVLVTGVVVFATDSARSAAAPTSGARVIVGPVAGAGLTGVLVNGRW